MPDILHRVGIKSATPDAIYAALTTRDGLAGWWTRDTELDAGAGEPGDTIRFRFGANGGFDMKIVDLEPGRRVRWQVVDGPADWIGTTIDFALAHQDGRTAVLFTHAGWPAPVEFMHACSTKWATFLLSLKALVETGQGAPWPNDVKIDELH